MNFPPQRSWRKDAFFLALLPSPTANACIYNIWRYLRAFYALKGRPILRDHLHVTLHPLGSFVNLTDDGLREWCQKWNEVVGRAIAQIEAPSFEVSFDRAMSFSRGEGGNPFVFVGNRGVEKLKAFQKRLDEVLGSIGLGGFPPSSFTPHVTLTYDERQVAEEEVEPVSWMADELVLVQSVVGKTRHIIRGRWPLRG